MGRISGTRVALFAAVLILIFGGFGLAKGGLYIGKHEGDTTHMVEIVLRMLQGEVPHLDFSTPIGIFAFLPVVAMAKLGLGVGQAFVAGQILVALILLPAVVRTAVSRLSGVSLWGFVVISMALALALVHGEDNRAISVSMFYNRWAWIAAFAAVLIAVLPPDEERASPRLDGLLLGLLMGALAMSKPTYFVALAVPVVIALITRLALRELMFALVGGLIVALAVVAAFGLDFFPAYVADLLSVARSETRAAPGESFVAVMNAPRFLIGTLTLLAGIVVLRQSGQSRAGLLLLLLAPAFFYITYQNFGNDPKWLMLLAIYLLAHRPEAGRRVLFNADARNATSALALVAFALITPSFQNILTSPFRHFAAKTEGYVTQIAGRSTTRDIYVQTKRTAMVLGRSAMVDGVPGLAPFTVEDDFFKPVEFLGEPLPRCNLQAGDLAMHSYMAALLREPPLNFGDEAQFYVADIASGIWMLGGFAPLEGGAPWYYSGTPGAANADAIVVPTCPIDTEISRQSLKALETAGLTLRPPVKLDVMWVYPVVKAASDR